MVHVTKNLIFIYSMQFINSSLESLVKNYKNKNFNLNICFKKFFENNLKKEKKKEYIHMNIRMALKKLMRQNYLKNYYSSLRDNHVSDENSAHANENNRRLL